MSLRLRAYARPETPDGRGETAFGDVRFESAAELPERVALAPEGELELQRSSLDDTGGLVACLACGHPELYTQKDFPRAAGIALVVGAAILAPFTNYISLFAAALIDFLLYHTAPNVVMCYVCVSEHRGFPAEPKHPRFDREIEERLLYGERAVMGRPMRPGGTADAPEPEH